MNIEQIVKAQNAKLDGLLSNTIERLGRIEGPTCNRYGPYFNVVNHPYWAGIQFRIPGNSLF